MHVYGKNKVGYEDIANDKISKKNIIILAENWQFDGSHTGDKMRNDRSFAW